MSSARAFSVSTRIEKQTNIPRQIASSRWRSPWVMGLFSLLRQAADLRDLHVYALHDFSAALGQAFAAGDAVVAAGERERGEIVAATAVAFAQCRHRRVVAAIDLFAAHRDVQVLLVIGGRQQRIDDLVA